MPSSAPDGSGRPSGSVELVRMAWHFYRSSNSRVAASERAGAGEEDGGEDKAKVRECLMIHSLGLCKV